MTDHTTVSLTDLPAARLHTLLRDVSLVLSTTVALAVFSNVLIPLPFTPVPISLATLVVLVSSGTLGPVRAGAGASLFLLAGVAGVPWFAHQGAGWSFPSFGYIVGYVLAALVVGRLVREAKTVASTGGAMVLGSIVVYAIGFPWLKVSLGIGWSEAFLLGVAPFLIGDGLKVLIATSSVRAIRIRFTGTG